MSTEREIIAYKPDLNIYGKPCEMVDAGYVAVKDDIKYSNNTKSKNSKVLRLFAANSPSSTVNFFASLMNDIDSELTNIKANVTYNKYENNYFSAKGEDEMQDILNKNKVDIDYGSDLLEIYSYLKKIYDDIKEILALYVKCIFGDNVDASNTDDIMESYISQLKTLEGNYSYEKVNYASLYYDTLVSYSLSDYISVVDTIFEDLKGTDISPKNFDMDNSASELLSKYFKKESINLDSLTNSLKNSKKDLITSLKNFYLEKQDYLSYLNTFAKISSYKVGKAELADIKSDAKKVMDKRFDNLIKAYMNYNLILGDVTEVIKNKVKYRSFFK